MKRSCKGNSCIAFLEAKIEEIDFHADTSRNGIFNRAVNIAHDYTLEELKRKACELKNLKKSKIPDDLQFPSALQVSVDENLECVLKDVEKNLKKALDLSNLQTRYEIEILFFIYLTELQKKVLNIGKREKIDKDLSGPEMVKTLVEILMLNRQQDYELLKQVKSVLLEWKI